MWPLIGVAVVVAGFVARVNPLLVVAAAVLATGLAAGMTPVEVVSAFGKAFNENRYVGLVWLVVPVIGLLERAGLQERAKHLIGKVQAATTGRLLLLYLFLRQVTAAFGLNSLGGHAQMVRPLIAPMAEAAAENRHGPLPARARELIRANAAAADNIGVFFGEDIFIAMSSILLIRGVLEHSGVMVEPLHLSVWAIPTAVAALFIHGARLLLLDRRLARTLAAQGPAEKAE
ncbi:DUF969 domain-containing protein [Caulobacter sp. CCUG 60055]|nr:DUF969 domain-containing protein [Caulobacter sp. CCUG 60055]MCI3179075.1 DUF969 domain-containing protein [Caulobacter sp. CCUG 60055]